MTDPVYRKFPDSADAILALRNKDSDFSQICDDYDEMYTWLATQGHTTDPKSAECVKAKEIIQDLEDEIIKKLEEIQ